MGRGKLSHSGVAIAMGINFPPSPTIGTLWPNPAVAGVPQYTWNGTVWTTVLAPPAFYAQDTAPVGAPVNALWWDTDSGVLFINYKDVSTTQWVATSATPAVDTSNFTTKTTTSTNRIVNGAMHLSQQWGNTVSGPTSSFAFYPADQWQAIASISPATATVQRVQARTPGGAMDRIRVVVFAAKTTLTAGDHFAIYQAIEGFMCADFMFGTAQAKQIIVRLGFKGPAGNYSVKVGNIGATRSYMTNFTIAAGEANTDTVQIFIIPGDTTGTWDTTSGTGVTIMVGLASGSNYHGIVGWQSGNFIGTATTSNGMAATNNTFELFDVGVYLDADNIGVPPKWQLPNITDELARCQRYFQQIDGVQVVQADGNMQQTLTFMTTMRAFPSATATGTATWEATPNYARQATTGTFGGTTISLNARM